MYVTERMCFAKLIWQVKDRRAPTMRLDFDMPHLLRPYQAQALHTACLLPMPDAYRQRHWPTGKGRDASTSL